MRPQILDAEIVSRIVAAALAEDLGTAGDRTGDAVIEPSRRASARLVARSPLVVAGLPVAREVFRQSESSCELRTSRDEGEAVGKATLLATVSGDARALLRAERTALNFLMRMCGIASATRAAVEEVARTDARILDTRKTVPGLRHLDKYAVAAGGGINHRVGLFDAVMVKDTHVALIGSVGEAVRRARDRGIESSRITAEVRTLDELDEAILAGAGRALLDNMEAGTVREAVSRARGRIVLEVSGGLRPGRLRELAETGVDFLSLGWLTHSAPAADVAMEMDP